MTPGPAKSAKPALPLASLPEPFSSLAYPCWQAPTHKRGHFVEVCGKAGLVAAVFGPIDMVRGVPPAAARVVARREKPSSLPRRNGVVLAHEGKRLWVALDTCANCRRIRGISAVADLDLDDRRHGGR